MRMLPVLPDESLFSRFCRTTTVYGMSPSSLLTIIFNKPDMNVHPILNSGLKAISLHTSESADQLWHEQTLLPLFAWALPISRNEIMDFNTTPARLNRLCRLSNFSLGQRTLLKFCPVCAREDTFHYGVTYWHLAHQLHGVTTCHRHPVALESIHVPSSPHIRIGLMPPVSYTEQLSNEIDFDFAKFCYESLNIIRRKDITHPNYMDVLKKLNLLSLDGNLKKNVFYAHVYAKCQLFGEGSSGLIPTSLTDYHYWEPILKDKCCQHPTKHLLLCYCLLNTCWPTYAGSRTNKKKEIFKSHKKYSFHIVENNTSVSNLGKEFSRSRCYIKTLIYKKYLRVFKRNTKINIFTELLIKSMAVRGFSLASIAEKNSLSEGAVSSVISSCYGLCSWRKKCKKDSLRRRHKQKILRFIHNQCVSITRKLVKESCYASFYWLNKHECDWLNSCLPKTIRCYKNKRVDWSERDIISSSLINDVLSQGQYSMSLTSLDALLGGHGWLLKYRDKLPMTMILLRKMELIK
ncbi:TnsD family Tn7-like transposition protein [Citrobacter freundii]